MIPLPWRIIGALAVSAALVGAGWRAGADRVQARWDAERAAQAVAAARHAARIADAGQDAASQFATSALATQQRTVEIIKKVPVYVTAQADADCTVPAGFVRLHDAAAADVSAAQPATGADDAPAGIALSAVAGTVAENYSACHQTAAQLIQLQGWVKKITDGVDAE